MPDTGYRAPLKIPFLLRLAAKSTARRCAHSPNHSGFDSFARLAQRLLSLPFLKGKVSGAPHRIIINPFAQPRDKIEYLEVPYSHYDGIDRNFFRVYFLATTMPGIGKNYFLTQIMH